MNKIYKKHNINSDIHVIYKNVLNFGDFGIWEWNLSKNIFSISCKFISTEGNKIKDVNNFYDFLNKFAIKQDIKSSQNDLNFYLKGNCSTYRSEFRIINKDNKINWILLKGNAIKNINGEIKIICGTIIDITARKNIEEEFKALAYYDYLTELPNRNLFNFDFESATEECKENNKSGALVSLDIDNFKSINDTYGHDYGDLLLKIFSQILVICSKDYGKVYRLSGDEFIILVDKMNSKLEVKELCDSIMDCCKNSFEVKDEQIYISVSIGISIFPKDSLNASDLYKFADLSMYESKINGKNRYTFFDENILNKYSRKILIEQELKNALKNNEFHVVYQPQVDAVNNKVVGFEALLRWKNNKLGNVGPTEFIPLAEKNGSIVAIGEWVLNAVCKKINELNMKGLKFETMSVNVSPIQLKKSNFVDVISKICKENNIKDNSLEIEITEGTLIDLHSDKIQTLNKIMEKGIKIAIDDFGTGYSSLNYLTVVPINTLKIDKSFIDNIKNEKNRAVINSILDLSRVLKYKVIAEGVETQEQVNLLMNCGCNIIQGYYFSQPILEIEIEDMLN